MQDCAGKNEQSTLLFVLQIYTSLQNRIVGAQPPDRQAHLSQCLDKLMADVQRNLEPKNRDKFTQVRALPAAALFQGSCNS